MRKDHVLEPTKLQTRPRQVIFFDTETKQIQLENNETLHQLKVGVAKICKRSPSEPLVEKEKYIIHSIKDFWGWVTGNTISKDTTYLVAHNLVFDLSVMDGFIELALMGWELSSCYSKGMISIFRWRNGSRRLVGLDNGNFHAGALAYWGELQGVPKIEIDLESCSDEELLIYCERDVDIMIESWRTWLQFLDENECGAFKPTVASTAFNTWRHRYMKGTVHIHSNDDVISLEREAYRGGRTECLWVGERDDGPFFYMDVNSMYGHVLSQFDYPAGLYGHSTNPDVNNLAAKVSKYSVIARVTLDVTQPWFPTRIKRHTCYPVGRFITTLTTPEIKHALRMGWILKVHELAWYRSLRLFKEYIDTFYQLRKGYESAQNDGYTKICKLLMNALYGKFGQRAIHQNVVGECDPDLVKREEIYDLDKNTFYDYVYLGGKIMIEWKEGESMHSFPAIAAHVTAYARMHLYSLVRVVEPGNVYYMDTDSLIINDLGFQQLRTYIHPHRLGMLKIEVTSPWLIVRAPKDYAMKGRHKTKGISSKAVKLGDGIYEQTHWMKLGGLIRAGMSRGYRTKKVIKHLKRIIHSGVVSPEGWIHPFVFPLSEPFQPQSALLVSERPQQP